MDPHPAPASPELVAVCREFLTSPTVELEERILRLLERDLRAADYVPAEDGFVEWGCVEHGVVDVFTCEGQQVIRIEPDTALIVAI